jgi:mannose-1-phosphate guanylyltransferase
MRLQKLAPHATVGFFPADHHFADNDAFCSCINQAYNFAGAHPEVALLLGITPDHPETSYGWIEPGRVVATVGPDLIYRIRRFWEKPSRTHAADLMSRGSLWNSFIMIGKVNAFLHIVRRANERLFNSFHSVSAAMLTPHEGVNVNELYDSIPSSGFSTDVLSVSPGDLVVLSGRGLRWVDVGDVQRALLVAGDRGCAG